MQKIFLVFITLFLITMDSVQADGTIVINEIMYNSNGEDIEFIELYNNSTTPINLLNWYILDDNSNHSPCKLSGILNPDNYWIISPKMAPHRNI